LPPHDYRASQLASPQRKAQQVASLYVQTTETSAGTSEDHAESLSTIKHVFEARSLERR